MLIKIHNYCSLTLKMSLGSKNMFFFNPETLKNKLKIVQKKKTHNLQYLSHNRPFLLHNLPCKFRKICIFSSHPIRRPGNNSNKYFPLLSISKLCFKGRCLLLLLRIHSAHLKILGFPISCAYQYRDILRGSKLFRESRT